MTRRHRVSSCAAPATVPVPRPEPVFTSAGQVRADLVLRFPRDWLGDWRAVAGGIDRLIAGMLRD